MSLDDVKGQKHAARFFRRAIANGKLAHAYIFAGPIGVGKAFFARELAKLLLCTQGKDDNCGECPTCLQVDANSHPDVNWINSPASERELKKKHVVEMRRMVGLKALTGEHKVFIIDDAEKLNEESANLLLLTLEEPPTGSLFLLLTGQPERMLSTIRSRCQVIKFRPLSRDLLEPLLDRLKVPAPEAKLLAQACGGSPGMALRWWQQGILPFRAELLARLTQIRATEVFSLATKIESHARQAADNRQAARWTVLDILQHPLLFYRRLWRMKVGAEAKDEVLDREWIEKLEPRLSPEEAREILEEVMLARGRIRANANITLALAELFSRVSQLQGLG